MTASLTHQSTSISRPWPGEHDPADVIVRFARQPGAFTLESLCNTGGYGRVSLFGCRPLHRIEHRLESSPASAEAAINLLAQSSGAMRSQSTGHPAFPGAWVGYVAYETGAALERVPTREPVPSLRFALYDTTVMLDHETKQWSICAANLPQSKRSAEDRLDEFADILQAPPQPMPESAAATPTPRPNMSRDDYLDKVRRAITYIEAGDIYQVNLTQRFTTHVSLSPLEIYLRLRQANPAEFSAFLPWGDQAVISSSPELFLDLAPDGRVVTRPIKGTRPRGTDEATDAALRAELLASEKDRAELTMIIDLLRNDLGRVCEIGSVRVVDDHALETHPTVHHLVGTIEGRLPTGLTAVDLLRATLPGGSITGCPKIRAMQIIHELEPTPRGPYCGAIGMIGIDGRMTTSVAIRTMCYDAGELHIHAGGAITADSDPDAEYEETLAKAEGMFRAIGCSTANLETTI